MCGICVFFKLPDVQSFKAHALDLSKRIRHRGPDWSGNYIKNSTIMLHERLSIVGIDSGAQPFVNSDESIALAVNGEIYNHRFLRKDFENYPFSTHSDCEPIIPLYQKYDIDAPKHLDGMFAFVLYDAVKDRVVAARDPIGITTLYMGHSKKYPGTRAFSSELKCLVDDCDEIIAFPPGHVYDSTTDKLTLYFEPTWFDESRIGSAAIDYTLIRETLEKAVRKRLMSEVPYGVLLSGGLDSSLIAAIAARETSRALPEKSTQRDLAGIDESGQLVNTSGSRLHSFAIGLPEAPDLMAAQKVAEYIGTIHHSHEFTVQEGLDSLRDVIYHLETFDVTTIRASTPMYLLSRKIKAQGIKMVLSGEGSDEIFGGYLYFGAAPSSDEFHTECVKRVKNLHLSDCLRANKSTLAWGLEARVPFLDKEFLEVCMNIDPREKLIIKGDRIEKYILRKAFDIVPPGGEEKYLPDEILWRQKEQFSDGVGYSWIDGLKVAAEAAISDEQLKVHKPEWGTDIPTTKEAYWYRLMFDDLFPQPAAASTVMRWIPKADWGCAEDPSGRFVKSHSAAI